jgi:hypothetical protein
MIHLFALLLAKAHPVGVAVMGAGAYGYAATQNGRPRSAAAPYRPTYRPGQYATGPRSTPAPRPAAPRDTVYAGQVPEGYRLEIMPLSVVTTKPYVAWKGAERLRAFGTSKAALAYMRQDAAGGLLAAAPPPPPAPRPARPVRPVRRAVTVPVGTSEPAYGYRVLNTGYRNITVAPDGRHVGSFVERADAIRYSYEHVQPFV